MKTRLITLLLAGVLLLSACNVGPTTDIADEPQAEMPPTEIPSEEMSEEEPEIESEEEVHEEEMAEEPEPEMSEDADAVAESEEPMEKSEEQEADYDEMEGEQEEGEMAEEMEKTQPNYSAYSPAAFEALSGSQPFALFFHASWCPSCRNLDDAINEKLPMLHNVNILKVDYDTETALKQEYDVRVQHTIVFFNADGSHAQTLVGSSADEVLQFFVQ